MEKYIVKVITAISCQLKEFNRFIYFFMETTGDLSWKRIDDMTTKKKSKYGQNPKMRKF